MNVSSWCDTWLGTGTNLPLPFTFTSKVVSSFHDTQRKLCMHVLLLPHLLHAQGSTYNYEAVEVLQS